MFPWPPDTYLVAGFLVALASLIFILIVSYLVYEHRKGRSHSCNEECGPIATGILRDSQKGVPASLRLVQSFAKVHSRILEEYQDELLAPDVCGAIDRFDHLSITSSDFDRCYATTLAKYKQADSLRGLTFSYSIDSVAGGGFLHTPLIQTYAAAVLTGSDGLLKIYSAHDRGVIQSVNWTFNTPSAGEGAWRLFGRVNSANGRPKYHLKLSTEKKKKGPKYALFSASDDKSLSNSAPELLLIKGRPQLVAWAASHAGMSKTALVFKIYAKAMHGGSKVQIGTIEPTIYIGTPVDNNEEQEESGRTKQKIFTSSYGDQLYSVKYSKSYVIDQEIKTAILGVAFLLCLRHYMKDLYRMFHRASLSRG